MSETKSKTKMKSGTIAVIALSVVLVLSLITTITLAYFTATRSVLTTVQFANGIKLQLSGVTKTTTGGVDEPPSTGYDSPVALYWNAKYVEEYVGSDGNTTTDIEQDSEHSGNYVKVDAKIIFDELKVRVVGGDAYVAVRIEVIAVSDPDNPDTSVVNLNDDTSTGLKQKGYVSPVIDQTNWKAYEYSAGGASNDTAAGNGWFMSKTAITGEKESAGPTFTTILPAWTLPKDATTDQINNYFAGHKFTCKVLVYASNTLEGLNDQVKAYDTENAIKATTDKAVLG